MPKKVPVADDTELKRVDVDGDHDDELEDILGI